LIDVRVQQYLPDITEAPTAKTATAATVIQRSAFFLHRADDLDQCWFSGGRGVTSNRWYQKQQMRQFCTKQHQLDKLVERITKVRKKDQQKYCVIAFGDGDCRTNIKGVPPIMSTTFCKKLQSCCFVDAINEFRTSMNCSCCYHVMSKTEKFAVLHCDNSVCTREFWNRDVNASINHGTLRLYQLVHGTRIPQFSRESVGARPRRRRAIATADATDGPRRRTARRGATATADATAGDGDTVRRSTRLSTRPQISWTCLND